MRCPLPCPTNVLEWTRKFTGLDVGGLNGSPGTQAAVSSRPGVPPPRRRQPPDAPADPTKQVLYAKETGDANDVSENDIHQGQVVTASCCPRSVKSPNCGLT